MGEETCNETLRKSAWEAIDLMPLLHLFNRDITSRSFSMAELLSKHSADLTPAGLCFFQASWDNSVTQTFLETLGKTNNNNSLLSVTCIF